MEIRQKGIVTLLRSAVTGERLPLPEGFRLEDAMDLIRSHGIASLAYVGGANCGLSPADPAMGQLFQTYCLLLRQSEGQLRALKALFARFEEAGIDYMPLKGTNMKALYPQPELRPMGDADVLIRVPQYRQKAPAILEALGYRFHTESDHELIWKAKDLFLELHKRMIPSYNDKFCAYFGDGWEKAVRQQGCRYALPPEEEYLYLITHFVKHYRDGGIGLRHVLDLWVYLEAHPELNLAYVRQELDKLGLLEFYGNLSRLMGLWFRGGETDPVTDFLSSYIFASGSWGQLEQHTLAAGLRGQSRANRAWERKLRYLLSLAFPRKNSLLGQYPILERHPWLLPGVWLWRIVLKVFGGRVQWQQRKTQMDTYTQEGLDRQRAMLDFVGLTDRF